MIHNIFPVSIYQKEYSQQDILNEIVMNDVLNYTDTNGKTGEHVFNKLHHLSHYSSFYTWVCNQVKNYMHDLCIDTKGMDVNITKSWFEVKRETSLAVHTHGDNHYSFVYYVNNPDDIRKDIFFCHPNYDHHHNEPHRGFFHWSRTEMSYENASEWTFPSHPGMLYIFPSKLNHGTVGITDPNAVTSSGVFNIDDVNSSRVVVAGDTIITINDDEKDKYNHLGVKNPAQWKTF